MLIVEDNEDKRLFMKEGFIKTGLYEITGDAENGNEMLKLLNKSSPHAERRKKLGARAYYTKPDTFLEYKEFAENIYSDVKEWLGNPKLECRGIKKLNESFLQKISLSIKS